jgi:hypothetical protein
MPEILTESFCERCGTRYTFESAAPKVKLKGLKVMSRGLRNFVLSDDTSMDEAMAAARNETDREQTSQQLDAFHKTFNFCMTCRQYTCGNCWNEAEGRCLSCAPSLGQEIVPAPFGNVAAGGAMTVSGSEAVELHDRNGHDLGALQDQPLAWPTSDLMREAEIADEPPSWAAGIEPDTLPEPGAAATEAAAEAGPVQPVEAEAPGEPILAAEALPFDDMVATDADQLISQPDEEPFDFAARLEAVAGPAPSAAPPAIEPELVAEPPTAPEPPDDATPFDDRAAAAAANTSDMFQRFRPGQSLDDEIEAYERAQAAAALDAMDPPPAVTPPAIPSAPPAPVAPVVPPAPFVPPVPVVPKPAAPIAASAEPIYPEAEPIYPEAEPQPVETFAPEPEPAFPIEPRVDYVPQPTWQVVAPESPPTDGVPLPPAQQPAQPPAEAATASAEPQWPATPQWPDRGTSQGLPFLGRPAAASGGIEALWAASAQEVALVGDASQVGLAGPAQAKPGGIQPCVSCGLSLSANARFCRRCGTRQG